MLNAAPPFIKKEGRWGTNRPRQDRAVTLFCFLKKGKIKQTITLGAFTWKMKRLTKPQAHPEKSLVLTKRKAGWKKKGLGSSTTVQHKGCLPFLRQLNSQRRSKASWGCSAEDQRRVCMLLLLLFSLPGKGQQKAVLCTELCNENFSLHW